MLINPVPIIFKEVWTTHTHIFFLNPEWTITQFMFIIKPYVAIAFDTNHFDIVETGQKIPGIPSEAAPKLEPSDMKLREKWGQNMQVSLSFYIRRRNHNYPELENYKINTLVQDDCPVCLETVLVSNRYSCIHSICTNCYDSCVQRNYFICPICRQN
jgi:hypothetical protein